MAQDTDKDSLWAVWNDLSRPDTARMHAMHDLTWVYSWQQERDSAYLMAQELLALAKSIDDQYWMAKAYYRIGSILKAQQQYLEAYDCHRESYEIFQMLGDSSEMAHALHSFAHTTGWQSDDSLEISLERFFQAMDMYRELGELESLVEPLNCVSIIYAIKGDIGNSVRYYLEGADVCEEIQDGTRKARALKQLANINRQYGELSKAIEYRLRYVDIYLEQGDTSEVIAALYANAQDHEALEQFPEALEAYGEVMELISEFDHDESYLYGLNANALRRTGRIHHFMNHHEKALEFYEKCLFTSREFGVVDAEAGAQYFIADSYLDQGKLNEAMEHAEIAMNLARKSDNPWRLAWAQYYAGKVYLALDRHEEAISLYENAMAQAQSDLENELNELLMNDLYTSYKETGQYSLALDVQEQLQIIRDSTSNEEKQREILQQQFRYAYEKKALADSLAMTEQTLAHRAVVARKDRTKNLLMGASLLILLITLGMWSRVRYIRRANARLAEEKERAEQSERLEQQFLTNMSHEIRTPMNAVLGMSNLLLDTDLTQKQAGYVSAIRSSSENLLVIINDILDLSKLEAGKVEIEKIPFSIREIISNVMTTLRFKAEEKGLVVDCHMSDSVPESVMGDPARLKQILMNLASNAVKFTEKGNVSIRVEKDTDGLVVFRVIDTGIGIREDKLNQLFDNFKQLDPSTFRKYGGSGLGLSITKGLVELQRGRIEVISEYGKGSQFVVRMPYQEAPASQQKSASSKKDIDYYNVLSGIRILVAEDNTYNQVVVNDTLENAIKDVTTTLAENGQEAIDAFRKESFDVILMDVQMPGMDGLEATRQIRLSESHGSRVPIIALTASVQNKDVDRCLEAGMDDFVSKPFNRNELLVKLTEHFLGDQKAERVNVENRHVNLNENGSREGSLSVNSNTGNGTFTNLDFLEEFTEGNQDLIRKYIGIYLKIMPGKIEKIKTAMTKSDYDALARHIHAIRPQLRYMGMGAEAELAETLEDLTREDPGSDKIPSLVEDLLHRCRESIRELEARLFTITS